MFSMKAKTSSNTVLTAIGVAVALLIVVAVVLALRPPEEFDPGTPEGAAQGYYQAILDGDEDLASTYMTEELRASCNGRFWYYEDGEDARIVITRSEGNGSDAELDVTIEVSYGEGPFGGSYDQNETLVLEHRGNRWLISEPTWPMDVYACNGPEG
ncbi:MAG: hypothetical protein BMS9Abin12_2362 [Acidimicrobiia bacterium]|nr:MAG: hypothetical protein BMS9Abin12_2362 [Acidimicrobiia bacterium]